ncbi:hypothetical protein Q9L58_010406 [Maublancomyces gigas]|uniref:Uncharacterized protein n=1 Tax=Discina gigas TaxID=1032678 RepID=A0ABR3G4K2_9PEZI
MVIHRIFGTVLLAASSTVFAQSECVELASVLMQEMTRNVDSFSRENVSSVKFCSAKYSLATTAEKADIEAGYKDIFKVKGGKDTSQLAQNQESMCHGKYGFEFIKSLKIRETRGMPESSAEIVKACIVQRAVRVTRISYAYPVLSFTVTNGEKVEASIRGWVASPRSLLKEECTVSNYSGKIWKTVKPTNSVEFACTLQGSYNPSEKQTSYGGGFITVDVPDSNLQSIPVPGVKFPVMSQTEQALRLQIEALQTKELEVRKELEIERAKVVASDTKGADDLKNLKASHNTWVAALPSHIHVFTVGLETEFFHQLPGSPRYYRLEDKVPGACNPNWGASARAYADSLCGGSGTGLVESTSTHGGFNNPCGHSIAIAFCKGP